jgi:hypothetical protein
VLVSPTVTRLEGGLPLKPLIIVLLVACLGGAAAATTPAHGQSVPIDPWAPLRFILGTWETTSSGQPGNGKGHRQYRLVLRDRFIEVRNTVTYPPQPKNPKGETHEDVGYISYDRSRKAFVFRQFHVEGFVNTYISGAIESRQVVLITEAIENIPTGWRARETYRIVSDREVVEIFELAEPAKEFTIYSETRMKRDAADGPLIEQRVDTGGRFQLAPVARPTER